MLAFYASRFGAVEINNTFYRMPAAPMLERWAQETPPGLHLRAQGPAAHHPPQAPGRRRVGGLVLPLRRLRPGRQARPRALPDPALPEEGPRPPARVPGDPARPSAVRLRVPPRVVDGRGDGNDPRRGRGRPLRRRHRRGAGGRLSRDRALGLSAAAARLVLGGRPAALARPHPRAVVERRLRLLQARGRGARARLRGAAFGAGADTGAGTPAERTSRRSACRARCGPPAGLAAVGIAYFAAARLGLSLAFAAEQVTVVWPPTGIALAALLLFGRAAAPGIWLGALAANFTIGEPLITALGIATGNTLEALAAVWLLRRVGFNGALERLRDVLALLGLGAAVAPAVSATLGVTSAVRDRRPALERFRLPCGGSGGWATRWASSSPRPVLLTWARARRPPVAAAPAWWKPSCSSSPSAASRSWSSPTGSPRSWPPTVSSTPSSRSSSGPRSASASARPRPRSCSSRCSPSWERSPGAGPSRPPRSTTASSSCSSSWR